MSLDLGNEPTAPPPSPLEQAQIRSALGIVDTYLRYDEAQGLSNTQKDQARENIDAVSTAVTVNGQPLSGNVSLDAADVGAATAAQGIDERVPTATGLTSKFATPKSSIANGDRFPILDSATTMSPKHFTWTSIKSTLLSYFNGIYAALTHTHVSADITDATSDATPEKIAKRDSSGGVDFANVRATSIDLTGGSIEVFGGYFGIKTYDEYSDIQTNHPTSSLRGYNFKALAQSGSTIRNFINTALVTFGVVGDNWNFLDGVEVTFADTTTFTFTGASATTFRNASNSANKPTGPYANDAAAAAGLVPVGDLYYHSNGEIHRRMA